MVAHAHTVVNPGTVVVEALDTLVADCTVTRPGSANAFAVRAKLGTIQDPD